MLYEVREKTKDLAEHHTALAELLDKTVVKELEVSGGPMRLGDSR